MPGAERTLFVCFVVVVLLITVYTMTSSLPFRCVVGVLAIVTMSQSAFAQVCSGSAPYSSGRVSVGAGAGFTDGARWYGGSLAFGAERGPFAGVGLSAVDYDDIDEGGTVVGVSGGYSIPVTRSRKVEVCPVVGFKRQTGPNVATEFGTADFSAREFGFGATIGAVASSSSSFDFVPSVGGGYNSGKATFKLAGVSESSTEDYFDIHVAAGFVVNKALTIHPSVSFPLGLENGDPSYGIGFGFNFGSSTKSSSQSR